MQMALEFSGITDYSSIASLTQVSYFLTLNTVAEINIQAKKMLGIASFNSSTYHLPDG
jgi:hypothetical protein